MQNNNEKESAGVRFLYNTLFGRGLLRIVRSRPVSRAAGCFMNSRLSKPLIGRFIRRNGIDMSDYENGTYRCFNDFFTRKIADGKRPFDMSKDALVSPCDGYLTAYRVSDGTVFPIKQSVYTVSDLLGGDGAADIYKDGYCLVFRLTVRDYHRYAYADSGKKGENVRIKGVFHTVRPIALRRYPVFVQNSREWTTIETENFGRITQIEIGATLVGKIKNHDGAGYVVRGDEKGMFMFGGSTIVMLLEKGVSEIDEAILKNSNDGVETPVLMGMRIGRKAG